MNRRFFVLAAPLAAPALVAGCGGAEPVWADEAAVARARYRPEGGPALTLFTMRNTGSGNGAHSGLMIDAGERVFFDPAGTFAHKSLPERNDVIYGMTPSVVDYYVSYHARETYYVVEQRAPVTLEQASAAMRAALSYGAVPKAQCARAVSAVLGAMPGIGARFGSTWFPETVEADSATLPGVVSREHRESDPDDRSGAVAAIGQALGG